jgi:hypothetical protein
LSIEAQRDDGGVDVAGAADLGIDEHRSGGEDLLDLGTTEKPDGVEIVDREVEEHPARSFDEVDRRR